MDETVMSTTWPGLENGGKSALIDTAATFFNCRLVPGGRVTPMLPSMLMMLCTVNGVCVVWSPEPSRPTTRP